MWKDPNEKPEALTFAYEGCYESKQFPAMFEGLDYPVMAVFRKTKYGEYWQGNGLQGDWNMIAWFDLPEFEGFENES